MGKSQRSKGAAAEREVCKILNDELGLDLKRNLTQYQQSDGDIEVGGWLLEVKRQENLSLRTWWDQAVRQAENSELAPAVVYRQSRQPWKVIIPLAIISPMFDNHGLPDWCVEFEYTATVLLDPMFTTMLRESLAMETLYMMQEKENQTLQ